MEQLSVRLALHDILESVNSMGAREVQMVLNGIAQASGVMEASDQAEEHEMLIPFGDQLMAEADWDDIVGGDVLTMEPAPTFSGKLVQSKDDGGTGPGRDE